MTLIGHSVGIEFGKWYGIPIAEAVQDFSSSFAGRGA
jgi:hypothetical protein